MSLELGCIDLGMEVQTIKIFLDLFNSEVWMEDLTCTYWTSWTWWCSGMRVVFDMTNNNLSPLGPRSPKKENNQNHIYYQEIKKSKHTLEEIIFQLSRKIKC